MKTHYRLWGLAMFAIATLLIGACERKPPPTLTGTVTSADQVAIRYQVEGHGAPALVFVHCWTCNRSEWDKQAAFFAPHYQVVRLDLAGHGDSGRERRNYSIEAFGADVAAVVTQLNLQRVVLVGHSMGGPVAVDAAQRLGDRVIGVVGVDTFYTGFTPPKDKAKLEEMFKPFEQNYAEASANFMHGFFAPGADPALIDAVVRRTRSADPNMALSAMRNTFDWYGRNVPAALDALGPRLRNINANPKGDGQPLHPDVVLIAGAGHFIPQEKPAEFNQALATLMGQFVGLMPAMK
jgi:pimeloyl-ACP methyl ester carboxylesterase